MKRRATQSGFTIVELLIVIVVIAILAAITIVAYNGIQERTRESALRSDLAQAVRQIEVAKASDPSEQYPATQAAAGIRVSSSSTVLYVPVGSNSYCVQVSGYNQVLSQNGSGQTVSTQPCLQNGLIGWWTLNDGSGDASGNGYDLAYTASTPVTGQNGQAAGATGFNGSTSIVATTAAPNSLFPQDFTISFWYNGTAWASGAATSFISKRTGSSSGVFMYRSSGGQLVFDCGGSSGANRWITAYQMPLNQWTHITATCDGNSRQIYVNGVLEQTGVGGSVNILNNAAELQFGAEFVNGYPFTGAMDDVRLYDRRLSAGEIQQLFAGGAQ